MSVIACNPDPVSLAVKYGQSRSVLDNLANEWKMNQFREEMIGCIKSLLEGEEIK